MTSPVAVPVVSDVMESEGACLSKIWLECWLAVELVLPAASVATPASTSTMMFALVSICWGNNDGVGVSRTGEGAVLFGSAGNGDVISGETGDVSEKEKV